MKGVEVSNEIILVTLDRRLAIAIVTRTRVTQTDLVNFVDSAQLSVLLSSPWYPFLGRRQAQTVHTSTRCFFLGGKQCVMRDHGWSGLAWCTCKYGIVCIITARDPFAYGPTAKPRCAGCTDPRSDMAILRSCCQT